MIRLALALLLATPVAAQAPIPPAPPPQAIKPVKPGFWMVTGAGGNVTVWDSGTSLVLVDDKLAGEANFNNLAAAIRTVSDKPVKAVFDTHHHGDHIGNNGRFIDAGVLVVGHDGLAARVAAFTPPPSNPAATPPAPPNLRFSRDFSLVMSNGRADAHHFIPGHTDGDAVVHFPAAKIVAMGDLLVAATPNVDYPGGANIGGWLATLDRVLALDFDTAIPGHGDAPMTRADVVAFRTKLATFLGRARSAIANGTKQDRLIAAIRSDDLGWTWTATSWPAARLQGLWTEAGGK